MFLPATSAAIRRAAFTFFPALVTATLLFTLPGCDKDSDAQYFGDTSRPGEISQAYSELQGGQPAQAYSTAQNFIQSNPGSPYRPEAYYIAGQALAAQGQFEQGKDRLEVAIDKTKDRNLKALAMVGRADCNMGLGDYALASRQYHWVQLHYKDVKPLHQDELMFKLGMAAKKANNQEWADYWFNQVNELYNTGPYAERARQEHSGYSPTAANQKPLVYWLQVDAFNSPEKAESAATALRAKGYRDVEVVPSTRNSYKVYELRVGKFNSKAEAGRAQVDAELAGLSTSLRPATVEPMK